MRSGAQDGIPVESARPRIPVPGGNTWPGFEMVADSPAPGQGAQRAVALDEEEPGRPGTDQGEKTLHDAISHRLDIEALGQEPRHPREFLSLSAALGRLAVESSILQGERRLVGAGLGQANLVVGEHATGLIADGESPNHEVAGHQWDREGRAIGGSLDSGANLWSERDAGIREHIAGDDHSPVSDGQSDRTDP